MYFQFLFSFMSVSERGKHKKWSARYKYKYSKRFVDGWWPNRVWNKYVIESRMQRINQGNEVRKQLFGIWFVYYTQSVAAAWNTLSILECFACAHLILLLLFLVPISCLRSLSSRRHAYNTLAYVCARVCMIVCEWLHRCKNWILKYFCKQRRRHAVTWMCWRFYAFSA